MNRVLILLSFVLLAACAKNVPVTASLSDDQVESLSADKSASLEIVVDNPDNILAGSPNHSCAGAAVLIRDSEITQRINSILRSREYPSGLGQILGNYPELARVMDCEDAPDGIFARTDILRTERLAPGDYTIYYLLTFISTAPNCQIWEIPLTVNEGDNKLVFSDHLEDRTEQYGFSLRSCRI